MSQRLLVFAPNWLGDAVMALPAIADLIRRALPDAVVDHGGARRHRAARAAWFRGIGTAVVLGTSGQHRRREGAVAMTPHCCCPTRFTRRGLREAGAFLSAGAIATNSVPSLLTRAVTPPVRVHQAAYYQQLTTALGFPPGALEPRLTVPQDLRSIGGRSPERVGVGSALTARSRCAGGGVRRRQALAAAYASPRRSTRWGVTESGPCWSAHGRCTGRRRSARGRAYRAASHQSDRGDRPLDAGGGARPLPRARHERFRRDALRARRSASRDGGVRSDQRTARRDRSAPARMSVVHPRVVPSLHAARMSDRLIAACAASSVGRAWLASRCERPAVSARRVSRSRRNADRRGRDISIDPSGSRSIPWTVDAIRA